VLAFDHYHGSAELRWRWQSREGGMVLGEDPMD
jgi:hypothetical protein